MAGLPKKYAKMGFKRGWAAYKRSKSSTKFKKRKMAKKKRTRRRKSNRFLGLNLSKVGAAVIYGAAREKMSRVLEPYTSKIPLGSISDEVGMFATAALLKKFLFKRAGVLRDALTIGQGIEAARVGEAIINGQVGLSASTSTSSSRNIF